MKSPHQTNILVLGIFPSSRGVGFALMAAGNTLIDWGVKSVKSGNKNARSLSKVGDLIDHYHPDVIVVEDGRGSRRSARVQALTEEIIRLAEGECIKVERYSRKQVIGGFSSNDKETKQGRAEYIAARFPEELSFRLPTRRRPWTSEDYRMDIFDAVALAEHYFRSI